MSKVRVHYPTPKIMKVAERPYGFGAWACATVKGALGNARIRSCGGSGQADGVFVSLVDLEGSVRRYAELAAQPGSLFLNMAVALRQPCLCA